MNGAYADTWHRSLVLESLMRDGLSIVNVTRRELADGLRTLARRQRDARVNSNDLDIMFTKRFNENTNKINQKVIIKLFISYKQLLLHIISKRVIQINRKVFL